VPGGFGNWFPLRARGVRSLPSLVLPNKCIRRRIDADF
jgi:hypothetical protein